MDGKLSIKGQVQNVSIPVQLAQSGTTTTATGTLPLKRLQFKIGEGEWAIPPWWPTRSRCNPLALTGVGKL